MLKIGLTGGIGSGKSTVARVFSELGVPVFVSDEQARLLQDGDEELKAQIVSAFGASVYRDGKLDRAKMAEIVFADPEKLRQLNAMVHPAVRKAFGAFCAQHSKSPYVINEAAILYETGLDKTLDKIIVVTAPDALRIERVMARDGVTEEAVRSRMQQQMPQEEKERKADFLILNDGKELLLPQVLRIHNSLG